MPVIKPEHAEMPIIQSTPVVISKDSIYQGNSEKSNETKQYPEKFFKKNRALLTRYLIWNHCSRCGL